MKEKEPIARHRCEWEDNTAISSGNSIDTGMHHRKLMSRDPYTMLCDSPRMRCIATVLARTRRKHFHSIVAWRVCWKVFIGLLPINALRKSVTISSKTHRGEGNKDPCFVNKRK
jgi:hypothetical protein